jgi:hypothetical protein
MGFIENATEDGTVIATHINHSILSDGRFGTDFDRKIPGQKNDEKGKWWKGI